VSCVTLLLRMKASPLRCHRSDATVPGSSDLDAAQKTHGLRPVYAKGTSLLAAAPKLSDIVLCTVYTLDRLKVTGELEDFEARVARRIYLRLWDDGHDS
jgi:hypothetical protein